MPLKEITIMNQKKEFVLHWCSKSYTFTSLCQDFGISRTTGYKYIQKYKQYGMAGLEPQSRAPHHTPRKTPGEIEKRILEIRKEHETWGAKKIRWRLEEDGIYSRIPARSTINLILKRNGMIPDRKKRVHIERRYPKFEADDCNEIWSADYKGHFKMGDKKTCYPLTICDTYTRYIFKIKRTF